MSLTRGEAYGVLELPVGKGEFAIVAHNCRFCSELCL